MSRDNHLCHWPGCRQTVPPRLWGCRTHWFALPRPIQLAIWRSYRPGQEIDKQPSPAYIKAARDALNWIRTKQLPTRDVPPAVTEPKEADRG